MTSRKTDRTPNFADRLRMARDPHAPTPAPPPTIAVGIVATATAHVIRANPEEE